MKFISSQTKVSADLTGEPSSLQSREKRPILFTRNGKLLGIMQLRM